MNILGIIAEYNPFHNGHMYHINQAKNLCNAEYAICVISGNFIQRGEPAIINKWGRTNVALNCGIDLVIELPFVYSMSSAEYFSYAAVKLLDSLGIITHICFGSECGSIEQLKVVSDILYEQPENYKIFLKKNLSKGLSFPVARELSLKRYMKETLPKCQLDHVIKTSNNILGIEYLKALRKLKSKIIPCTIKRIGSSYNEQSTTNSFSSATSIRKVLLSNQMDINNKLKTLNANLPKFSLQTILSEITNGRGPISSTDFDSIAMWELRKYSVENLCKILYISEGFENRLKSISRKLSTIQQLIDESSTKRFTITRIQRTIFNTLIGFTSEDFDFFNRFDGPQYIRILGFNKNGRQLLSRINKTSSLPVFVNFPQLYKTCNTQIKKMLNYEILSTDLYVLAYKNPNQRHASQDFMNNIIILP